MTFEYKDYYSLSLKIPLGLCIIFSILLIIIIIKIINIPSDKAKFTISNSISIIILILLILSFVMRLDYGIHLLYENEYDYKSMCGKIETIEDVYFSPRYYYNDKAVHAKIITIDGKRLYFMTNGELEVGDYIKVEYLPKSTFVLKVELIHDSN